MPTIITGSDLNEKTKPSDTYVIRAGADVPWDETREDIESALKKVDNDLDGFVMLMRIAATLFVARSGENEKDKSNTFTRLAYDIVSRIRSIQTDSNSH